MLDHRSLRSQVRIAARRTRVSELYLSGKGQHEIAAIITVEFPSDSGKPISQQIISYDLKNIREQWRSSAIRDFDQAKSLELARLDEVEREAWQGWRRSIGKTVTTTKHAESDGTGSKKYVTEKSEKLAGDPRFLQAVLDCIRKRCEILGVNAPTKAEWSGELNVTPDEARKYVLGELAGIAERTGAPEDHTQPDAAADPASQV